MELNRHLAAGKFVIKVATWLALAGMSSAILAADSEDWALVTDSNEYHAAVTVSDSGSAFGQWCYFEQESCIYIIAIDLKCEEGAKYPVLANSEVGTKTYTLVCRGPITIEKKVIYRMVFDDFDAIDEIVRRATRVGFAIPLESGKFQVVRFGLRSSNVQIDRMRAIAQRKLEDLNKRRPSRGKDQVL